MEKLSHFQLKLIMCFISVGHYFIHCRNHHLSTYKLSTTLQTQTLKASLPLLPLPQSQWESSLDCQPGDTVMFCHFGKQVSCLCNLPKDTEMLHQVGNQIPTPTPRHCVPASAETGSLFHVSRQRPCPPRTYTLPTGKRTPCSSSSVTASLAASKKISCSQVLAAEETQLPACKQQVCSGPREGARALMAQRKQPPAVLSNQIRQFLVSGMLVFLRPNSWKPHNFNKVGTCLKSWSGKRHFSSDSGYETNNLVHISELMFLYVHGIHLVIQ